jgi:T4 bacteriophage base plate protein
MALPKIDAPTYEITLPVSKKKLQFRPFLVKEQKILLMAMESDESKLIENNVQQVLNNCCLTDINMEELPLVDMEYYFLNLRARSVGEVVDVKYKCENEVDGKPCGNIMESKFNLLDVKVDTQNVKDNTIKLKGDVGVKLKYPDYAVVKSLQQAESIADIAFELIIDCIDYVFDGDAVYYASETSREELMSFLESLTQDQFAKLEEFIDSLPKIEKKIELDCKKCGFHHTIDIEGLESFFG